MGIKIASPSCVHDILNLPKNVLVNVTVVSVSNTLQAIWGEGYVLEY